MSEEVEIVLNKLDELHIQEISTKLINKGTGAGGKNTNKNGKKFEENTDIIPILIELGFQKKFVPKKEKLENGFYFIKRIDENKSSIYVQQSGLKIYLHNKYKINLNRQPDGAMIFTNGNKKILHIIEKKAQNGSGSVDTKLYCGNGFKREYKFYLGDNWRVDYSFCLNDWLKKDYYSDRKKALRKILDEDSIEVYFGDDDDFKEKILNWIKYPENWDF